MRRRYYESMLTVDVWERIPMLCYIAFVVPATAYVILGVLTDLGVF